MPKLNLGFPQHMLRVLLVSLLMGGLLFSLAHISEADHGSHEALCAICVLFHTSITLVSVAVVFHRSIDRWICYYFIAEPRLLYHLPSTGRSPPHI
ncbi:MAG: hypothetical protein ACPHSD_19005 [Candidatus Latescibacterota bacterium]